MIKRKSRSIGVVGNRHYAIGYGRPPVESRFQPGRSGNAKSRRHGSRNLGSIFQKILNEKVSVREGDRVWLISKIEAMMRNLAVNALKGDAKAIAAVLALAQEGGQFAESPLHKVEVCFVRAKDDESES
jgi:Family of unknown function (DUF5681)